MPKRSDSSKKKNSGTDITRKCRVSYLLTQVFEIIYLLIIASIEFQNHQTKQMAVFIVGKMVVWY